MNITIYIFLYDNVFFIKKKKRKSLNIFSKKEKKFINQVMVE